MIRAFLAAALFALLGTPVLAQSSPNWTYKQVITAGQWNAEWSSKQDVLGYSPVNIAGATMLGPLITAPSTTGAAGFNVPPGTAPTLTNNGDVWTTSAGLFVQINGATIGPISNGTVSSVGLVLPSSIITVTGSPVTGSGNLTGALATQTANRVWAGPTTGSPAAPTFRAIVAADLPAIANSGLATMAANTVKANITGGSAVPVDSTLSAVLDAELGNTQGNIAYRNGSLWTVLAPGSSGQALESGGPAANPSWATLTGLGTVSSVGCGAGLGGGTITTTGTCTVNYGTSSTTAAVGNDSRITGAVQNASTSTITAGYTFTPGNLGTISSGTTTLAGATGNYQFFTDNGAFTLAAPAADAAITLMLTNGASAGTITFSGFTVGTSTGDVLDTVNGHKFLISVVRINGTSTYVTKAMQ